MTKAGSTISIDCPPAEEDTSDVFEEVHTLAGRWKSMCICLKLLPSVRDTICEQYQSRPNDCLMEVLVKWLRKCYNTERFGRPSWRMLVSAVANCAGGDNPALAEKIAEKRKGAQSAIATGNSQPVNPSSDCSNVLSEYAQYLRCRYKHDIPTVFTPQWPPTPTQSVLHLAMIPGKTKKWGSVDEKQVILKLQRGIDHIVFQKTLVELKDIFILGDTEHEVILIEGAPGAGKSTLAWNICQKWGTKELFEKFRTVVFIQLRDPTIHSAKSVENIFPAESREQAKDVVAEIKESRGQHLLFVMDGWDELPLPLQTDSIFSQLIVSPETLKLDFSTVIITSRPIATGDLCECQAISSCIEILGFTSTEVKRYFTEALGPESVHKLQQQLKKRPIIEASCYLPLNAAIVTHLFLAQDQSLPTTLHGVFTSLVICCLVQCIYKPSKGHIPEIHISSLDNLPTCLQEPFNNICSLAYHGVMENKATYSAVDLEKFTLPKDLETLGLIQGVESFMSYQRTVTYNFLHLSVQELLAAFHISKLTDAEQVKIFEKLFDQPRFTSVFQFYAAFTKLQSKQIIANIVKNKNKDKPQLVPRTTHCASL